MIHFASEHQLALTVTKPLLAITAGDPTGVGPEVILGGMG